MVSPYEPREALIPVVARRNPRALASAAGELLRVEAHARDVFFKTHLSNTLEPAKPLVEYGLYNAGAAAWNAVDRLRRPSGDPPRYLQLANVGTAHGLDKNDSSAELGLALVRLSYESQRKHPLFLATGQLDNDADRTVPVKPVASLNAKLRLALERFTQESGHERPRYFFVPREDAEGELVAESHGGLIQALKTQVGIEVVPVTSLADAAKRLGVFEPKRSPGQWLRRIGRQLAVPLGTALLTTVGLGAVGAWLLQRPVDVAFRPALVEDGPDVGFQQTPFRFQGGEQEGFTWLSPCLGPDDIPLYFAGNGVALDLSVEPAWRGWPWVEDSYGALVFADTAGRVNVKPLAPFATTETAPGTMRYRLRFPVRVTDETTLMAVVVRRGWDFNYLALENALRQLLKEPGTGAAQRPLTPLERLSSAENFLNRKADGLVSYTYRSVSNAPQDDCS